MTEGINGIEEESGSDEDSAKDHHLLPPTPNQLSSFACDDLFSPFSENVVHFIGNQEAENRFITNSDSDFHLQTFGRERKLCSGSVIYNSGKLPRSQGKVKMSTTIWEKESGLESSKNTSKNNQLVSNIFHIVIRPSAPKWANFNTKRYSYHPNKHSPVNSAYKFVQHKSPSPRLLGDTSKRVLQEKTRSEISASRSKKSYPKTDLNHQLDVKPANKIPTFIRNRKKTLSPDELAKAPQNRIFTALSPSSPRSAHSHQLLQTLK